MRISFQFRALYRYDLEFGFKNSMWMGMHWFTITKVELDTNGEVEYAYLLFTFLTHPRFWFK
jgi:hypothetical protein